jgi:hypothetical protein
MGRASSSVAFLYRRVAGWPGQGPQGLWDLAESVERFSALVEKTCPVPDAACHYELGLGRGCVPKPCPPSYLQGTGRKKPGSCHITCLVMHSLLLCLMITAGGPTYNLEGAPPKPVLLGWGFSSRTM